MTTTTKRCTKCGEAKPLEQFYLHRATDPSGPRRSICKSCSSADTARRRREGPSIITQLVRNFGNPNAALSAEAEAAIYTDEPVDPERLVNYHKRLEAERKRQQEVERRRQASGAPMRFAASAGR